MKKIILLGLLTIGFSGLAEPTKPTPTGDKAQFQVVVDLSMCKYNKKGEIQECTGITEADRIRDNVSAELLHSECRPACKYNDSAGFPSKTYTVKSKSVGQDVSIDVSVWFSRQSDVFNDAVPSYDVQLSVGSTNGKIGAAKTSLTSVKDFAGINEISLEGSPIVKKNADGSYVEIQPTVALTKFQVSR